ncbi:hypothetical protein [Oceanicoccus sp. KOV_DT_Chl]|uniref:hypothetical protein n=1 Tax=Oceanicoccus sp. KOV_DT_Chl TaxID=1904639 RepID=UPI000C7DF45B|nr:hypothetical protein [Oceanicoccus sp. KOV_DT_Chl]
MKFTADASNIICSRVDTQTKSNLTNEYIVAHFDKRLKEIPPHVESQLTDEETDELRHWLLDREKIKQDPSEKNLLELLPKLMDEGIVAIDELDTINQNTFNKLLTSIDHLRCKLLGAKSKLSSTPANSAQLNKQEANKERLDQVAKHII